MGRKALAAVFLAPLAGCYSADGGPIPPAPAGLTATVLTGTLIGLSWSGIPGGGTYHVERSVDGGAFSEIALTSATIYSDAAVLDDATYSYRVRARQGAQYSGYSNVATATTPAGDSWRTLGGNPRHSHHNSLEAGAPPLTLLWTVDLSPPGFYSSIHPPVIEGGRVYAAVDNYSVTRNSTLSAVDASTGAVLWTNDLGYVPIGHPAVRQGRVFLQHLNSNSGPGCSLKAFDGPTGALLWSAPFPGQWEPFWAPLPVGGAVYVQGARANGGVNGSLLAFDAPSGAPLFANTSLEPAFAWSPAYDAGSLYTFVAGNLRRHDPATGLESWNVVLPWGNFFNGLMNSAPVPGGGLIYVVSFPQIHAVDPVARRIAWSLSGYRVREFMPAYADGVVYVNHAGTVLALDAPTGAPLWSFSENLNIEFPPVVANNHLFLSSRNDLYAVDLTTRQIVWREENSWGGPMAVTEGKLFVARITGRLSAYALSSGTLPDRSTPPAAPTGLVAAPAGTGRIDLSWTDASSNETGFLVERSADGVAYAPLTALGAGATGFMDTGLLSTLAYRYRVVARNAAGASSPSNVATASPSPPGNAWNMAGNNPQHTGQNLLETGRPPVTPAWTWASGAPRVNPVTVEDGRVFVSNYTPNPGEAPRMTALEAAGGAVLWTHGFIFPYAVAEPPTVLDGRVYYAYLNGSNSKLFILNASTGKAIWASSFLTQSQQYPSPTVADGTVHMGGGYYGGLSSFDAQDGRFLWFDAQAYVPGCLGGVAYTHKDDLFRALDGRTGVPLWSVPVPVGSMPTVTPIRAHGITTRDLFSVDLATRTLAGTAPSQNLNNLFAEPSYDNGVLYWNTDGTLQARRESDLQLLWSFAGDGQLRGRPAIANGFLYAGGLANTYILNLASRQAVATIPIGGWPTVAAGKLFIAGFDGVLYAYRLTP